MAAYERTYALKNGETLLVRSPRLSDAKQCLSYLSEVGAETDYLYLDESGIPGLTVAGEEAYLRDTLADPRIGMYLGFVGERLIAMFDVRPESARERTAHNGLVALSVVADYWHMGVGSLAMETMIAFARETGLVNLTLTVHSKNVRAISLYEKYGFRAVGRHEKKLCIRGEYFDELLMDLTL